VIEVGLQLRDALELNLELFSIRCHFAFKDIDAGADSIECGQRMGQRARSSLGRHRWVSRLYNFFAACQYG
jgi:hypothetical protein